MLIAKLKSVVPRVATAPKSIASRAEFEKLSPQISKLKAQITQLRLRLSGELSKPRGQPAPLRAQLRVLEAKVAPLVARRETMIRTAAKVAGPAEVRALAKFEKELKASRVGAQKALEQLERATGDRAIQAALDRRVRFQAQERTVEAAKLRWALTLLA